MCSGMKRIVSRSTICRLVFECNLNGNFGLGWEGIAIFVQLSSQDRGSVVSILLLFLISESVR